MIPKLDELTDDELKQVGLKAAELLQERDTQRKEKAIAEARASREQWELETRKKLESVGLSMSALEPRKRRVVKPKPAKPEAKSPKGKAA
jgi:hypothetical protein